MSNTATVNLTDGLSDHVREAMHSTYQIQGMAKAAMALIGPPGDGKCDEDDDVMSAYFVLEVMGTHLLQILDKLEKIGARVPD